LKLPGAIFAGRAGGATTVVDARTPFNGAYEKFPDGPAQYRSEAMDASIGEIFRAAVAHATSRIEWYGRNAGTKAKIAKRIRFTSLILFALGTIAPISVAFLLQINDRFLKAAAAAAASTTAAGPAADAAARSLLSYFTTWPMAETGYVLLAIAGALIIFDQFFDSSGSWIRFRQSEARLQVLLADFRFGWAGAMAQCGGAPDTKQVGGFVTMARDFVTKVEILAEEETSAWAQRFSQRLSTFDQNPSLKVSLSGERPAAGAASGAPNGAGATNGRAASDDGAGAGASKP
jgi:hypothetical protein